jgi:hypothetical protein
LTPLLELGRGYIDFVRRVKREEMMLNNKAMAI